MQTLKSNYFSQLRNNKTLRNNEKYVNTTFPTFCCLQSSKYFLRYLETAAFSCFSRSFVTSFAAFFSMVKSDGKHLICVRGLPNPSSIDSKLSSPEEYFPPPSETYFRSAQNYSVASNETVLKQYGCLEKRF